MRESTEPTDALRRGTLPNLVVPITKDIGALTKSAISDLRARFNPRLVGFGIAGPATDVLTESSQADAACRVGVSEDQK